MPIDTFAFISSVSEVEESYFTRICGFATTAKKARTIRFIERAFWLNQHRFRLAVDSDEEGLWEWDRKSGEFWMSARWCEFLGYSQPAIERDRLLLQCAVRREDRLHIIAALQDHTTQRSAYFSHEHRVFTASGNEIWVQTRGCVIAQDNNGRATRAIGTQTNITRRKSAELQIQYLANHDFLTRLPNRSFLRQKIESALALRRKTGVGISILACDLDLFKAVNDSMGHAAGDELLQIVAIRMQNVLDISDTVARVGGDEFAILMVHSERGRSASRTARDLIATVGQAASVSGRTIRVGLSVGFLVADEEDEDPDELLRRADVALYDAKESGRNTSRMYRSESSERIRTRSKIDIDLKQALIGNEFYLRYQPVIDVDRDEVVSFEALLRWRHPELGELSPADFIPAAESSGMIVQLGAWALQEACLEAGTWPESIRVAVNVSAIQLRHTKFETEVLNALNRSGLKPNRLKLEVTESVLMQETDTLVATLMRLRRLGVAIALDDFGSGYSSLGYLRKLPFDKIKLDRSFIKDIAHPDAAAIVRAVVDIGDRLGMTIVAEGVETKEQAKLVRREGCKEMQGFLFSVPLSPSEARLYLRQRDRAIALEPSSLQSLLAS